MSGVGQLLDCRPLYLADTGELLVSILTLYHRQLENHLILCISWKVWAILELLQ
jgi:hypothetical protein